VNPALEPATIDPHRHPMNSTTIDGLQLETVHLPGPPDRAPLVFLHEGLGSVSMWRQRGQDWPRELCAATGRAGWVYSRRGYGQSDPVADVRGPSRWQGGWHVGRHEPDYMHLEAFNVLPRLFAAWGVERPVLVGHSDGASIALLHASRHPVSACVVLAPHVFVEDIALNAIAQARNAYLPNATGNAQNPQAGSQSLRDRLARHHADVDNAFWQWNDIWLSDAFRAFDIRPECRQIQAPLLAIQGLQDEYGSLEQLREIERAAPHARTLEIPDCGHSPHRDHPATLTSAIERFLASLP
jgi:pimeloyl-ACP methyl ester carboxylesterase